MNHDIIWKDIKGYEGIYEISNHGVIKNKKTNKVKKQYIDCVGYYVVSLCKNNISKPKRVHCIIAETFIPNPLNLPCINHKDENKLNNNIENLEWCTKGYNNRYGSRVQRITQKRKKKILQIDSNGVTVKEWDSIKEAANELGCNETQISRYARGVIKGMYKGFYWKYTKPFEYKPRKGKKIGKYDKDGNLLEVFSSIMEASYSSTVSSFTISTCLNGRCPTAGGYYWRCL